MQRSQYHDGLLQTPRPDSRSQRWRVVSYRRHRYDGGQSLPEDHGPEERVVQTSGGKYVAPAGGKQAQGINLYRAGYDCGTRTQIRGALIIRSFRRLARLGRKNNLPEGTNEELIKQPWVTELYKEIVESFNKYFNHVEQVKKFELLPQEWTVDTGELTPKLSMKRKVITEKFRDAIERIYS